jgi:hypothetical protein
MSISRHGLSIGIENTGNQFYLSFKAIGKLTHEDYEVITPMIDSALEGFKQPRIRALIDCTELDGWELRAGWDDFKLGLKHGSEFDKIALYGNKGWQQMAAKIGSWFISGESKYFEDFDTALEWLDE